jgi:hypothetical protein
MPKKEDLIYFLSLELENVRCFGSPLQSLDLTDQEGHPARWTLLLGENGLGKTTLSECLLWMQFVPSAGASPEKLNDANEGITKGPMEPSLPEAANDLIESFIRIGSQKLDIKAKFSQGLSLTKTLSKGKKSLPIKTGIGIFFKDQKLENYSIDPDDNSKIEDILGGKYKEPFIITYGASRAIGNISIYTDEMEDDDSRSNFLYKRLSERTELFNAEEILRYFETKALKSREQIPKNGNGKETPEELLYKDFKQIIVDILPIDEINIKDIKINDGLIYLNTFSGKDIPFTALSLGYQTTISLAIDIGWRLFQNYPKNKTPLDEPAIILIDEIDLHLHPRWQRTIIEKLANIFTGTQFIATSHSPMMVQAANDVNLTVLQKYADKTRTRIETFDVNLAVLQKDGNKVRIENDLEIVYGWRVDQLRVDQILNSPIFGIDDSTRGTKSENLFNERSELLKKLSRTPKEESRLTQIRKEISNLPTASSMEDMDFIRRATALLEKKKVERNDSH